ncbi:hypothetical protein DFH29DRAFT_992293 [Suillus ampliporus]|nr:hypothetical protein DFH29DRAFT_992293 [Suillus ampliporus]
MTSPLSQRSGLIEKQTDHGTAVLDNNTLLCSIFLDGIPSTEKISLGSLSSILERSYQCSFCRLISFHVRRACMSDKFPHVDLSGIEFGMFTSNSGCLRKPFYRPKFRCYYLRIVVLNDPDHLLERYPAFRAGLLYIHLMQEDAFKFGRPTDLHGRRVKNTVDIGLVKKWIKLCHENHGDKCGNVWRMNRKLPGFVRVVDVVSMAVIPAPSGCCYVSLSYVWGSISTEYWTTKDNIMERSKPGGLSVDSILFVRQLGERYIWIDALTSITQLNAMELVYGLSHLTIIAAGSKTARDPLPGCRPRTRPLQHIEVVQGFHLYVAPPRLKEAVALSTWNTRCWTYQESALSRRRIYFTARQVYFECQGDIFCEDIIAESKGHRLSHSFLQRSFGEPFPCHESFLSYMGAVETCTRRNLTVESDIVDALTGVTNALSMSFGLGDPARAFQHGMMLTDLHLALLWYHNPHAPRIRRPPPHGSSSPWPSWSWAAWRGAVIYMSQGVYARTRIGYYSSEPLVKEPFIDPWYIVDHSGNTVQLDVRRVSRIFWTEEEHPAYSSPRGILDPAELTLDIHRPLEPGTLIFRTTSSHFGITRRGKENEESSASVHHGHFNILSTSSPPTWVGTAILPLDPPPPTPLEFIVLSRSSGVWGAHDESLTYYDECLLHVMAVSQNEGLMERIGLGVIHEAAWITSKLEEKVVFLR